MDPWEDRVKGCQQLAFKCGLGVWILLFSGGSPEGSQAEPQELTLLQRLSPSIPSIPPTPGLS